MVYRLQALETRDKHRHAQLDEENRVLGTSQCRHILRAIMRYIQHNKTPELRFTDLPSLKSNLRNINICSAGQLYM